MCSEMFMLAAIQKAREGIENGQTPFGACVVKNESIISCSHNAVWEKTDITAHAEIIAIREACFDLGTIDLSGCVIYSTCEPCPMCFSACHWARIPRIVFGARIGDAEQAGFNELCIGNEELKKLGNLNVDISGGFMREECTELFTLWHKKQDKKAY